MMKKILNICAISFIYCGTAFAADSLNLSGTYTCSGYDSHDKGYQNAKVVLTLDAKNSELKNGFGAYNFKLIEADGTNYKGEVAANGNILAVYFENTGTAPVAQSDRGVGVAVVTHDKDVNGKAHTVFHKFYYEPNYQGGGNGSETCVKND